MRQHGCLNPPPPFHWTAIPLRSWRSRIFSKIIPNCRGSVDCHTIWGLDASSTLPPRFYYASVTLLLPSRYDTEDPTTLSLRWWRCSCDLATTLAMELRFRCAFVSFIYRIWKSDTLLLRSWRFYCALAVSFTIRVILTKISNRSGIVVQWNGGLKVLCDKYQNLMCPIILIILVNVLRILQGCSCFIEFIKRVWQSTLPFSQGA